MLLDTPLIRPKEVFHRIYVVVQRPPSPDTGCTARFPAVIAHAEWTEIKAAGTVLVGMVLLEKGSSPVKILSVSPIVAGVIGLNLVGATH